MANYPPTINPFGTILLSQICWDFLFVSYSPSSNVTLGLSGNSDEVHKHGRPPSEHFRDTGDCDDMGTRTSYCGLRLVSSRTVCKNYYKRRPVIIPIDNAGTSTKVCLMSNFCYGVSNFQQVCFYEWPYLHLGLHQSSGPNAAWIRQWKSY